MKSASINLVKRMVLLTLVLTMSLATTCQFLNVSYTAEALTYTIPNGTYWIINAHSGKALTVYNSGTTEGTNVVQSDNVNGTNQRWNITTNYNPNYSNQQFTMLIASGTPGLCLSTAISSLSNGVNVELGTTTEENSYWDIYKVGTRGNYMIRSKIGTNFAVAVENASATNVYINTYNGADYCNDEWIFVPVTTDTELVTATVKVQLDSSVRQEYDNTSEFRAIFADATKPFYNKFDIQLIPTFYNLQSVPADGCSLNYDFTCSQNLCGSNDECSNTSASSHHKNFKYNGLWTFINTSMTNFDFRLVMTAQNACYINDSGTHSNGILGTTFYKYNSMIVKCNEYSRGHTLNVRVIQHELSHAFGCDECNNRDCIMCIGGTDWNDVDTYNLDDIWCSSCEATISSYLDSTD